MSEEQNSRLYNENNDYGERDYAPRKSGKKKKRKESGGHVGRCILQVLGTLLLASPPSISRRSSSRRLEPWT